MSNEEQSQSQEQPKEQPKRRQKTLTIQRQAVLREVDRAVRREGRSPTLQQIADALGTTISTVSYHLKTMVSAGILQRGPGKAGGWYPTGQYVLPEHRWQNVFDDALLTEIRQAMAKGYVQALSVELRNPTNGARINVRSPLQPSWEGGQPRG